MGRSYTPKYRIELSFVDFKGRQRKIDAFGWSCKRHGRPSEHNAKRFRDGMNESLEKGMSNEHLKHRQSAYGTARIIEQSTGDVIATYKPPMFEVVS